MPRPTSEIEREIARRILAPGKCQDKTASQWSGKLYMIVGVAGGRPIEVESGRYERIATIREAQVGR